MSTEIQRKKWREQKLAWRRRNPLPKNPERLRQQWREANRRYRKNNPEANYAACKRYNEKHPDKRRETLYNWRRKSISFDRIQIRHELSNRMNISSDKIPIALINQRAVLRRVRRLIRTLK